VKSAHKPDDDDDHQNGSENASESCAAVAVMRVIAAASAEEEEQDDDNQKSAQGTSFRRSGLGSAVDCVEFDAPETTREGRNGSLRRMKISHDGFRA
jgi:hypothetical protein